MSANDRPLKLHHVDSRPFRDLLNSPEDFNMVFESIEHTIMSSFAIDAVLNNGIAPKITAALIKERWNICEKWFRIMRGDIGFSLRQTIDTLPKALACEMLDQPFEPVKDTGQGWAPMSIEEILQRQG